MNLDQLALDRLADDGCPNFTNVENNDPSGLAPLSDPISCQVGIDIVPLMTQTEEVA
jgi:hypothetical protein